MTYHGITPPRIRVTLGKSVDYHLGVSGLFIPPLCLNLVFDLLTVSPYKSEATSPSLLLILRFLDRCHMYFYTVQARSFLCSYGIASIVYNGIAGYGGDK